MVVKKTSKELNQKQREPEYYPFSVIEAHLCQQMSTNGPIILFQPQIQIFLKKSTNLWWITWQIIVYNCQCRGLDFIHFAVAVDSSDSNPTAISTTTYKYHNSVMLLSLKAMFHLQQEAQFATEQKNNFLTESPQGNGEGGNPVSYKEGKEGHKLN